MVNVAAKFSQFSDHWAPRIVGALNNYQVKVVKVQGEFVWHAHPETDELFWVHKGELILEFRDGTREVIRLGEFHVVPRGVEHRPVARDECELILIEPASTVNTGNSGAKPTEPVWL